MIHYRPTVELITKNLDFLKEEEIRLQEALNKTKGAIASHTDVLYLINNQEGQNDKQ